MIDTDSARGPRRLGGSDGLGPGRESPIRTPVRWLLVGMLGILLDAGAKRVALRA